MKFQRVGDSYVNLYDIVFVSSINQSLYLGTFVWKIHFRGGIVVEFFWNTKDDPRRHMLIIELEKLK